MSIKIANTGKIPILKGDFENPIEIFFAKTATLIDAEVHEKYPKNLDVKIISKENKISFLPCLINPND